MSPDAHDTSEPPSKTDNPTQLHRLRHRREVSRKMISGAAGATKIAEEGEDSEPSGDESDN